MAPDIRVICKTKPKTAFDELKQLDSKAIFRYCSGEFLRMNQKKIVNFGFYIPFTLAVI